MAAPASLWWRSADGGRLHALDWAGAADRLPIVGLPGLNRNARDFAPLAGWLHGAHRVIGVDLRGRGGSDADPDPQRYAMPAYLDDLDRLWEQHGLGRALLFGTSLGGVIAALYAARRPERVAGLLFNDVAHRFEAAGFARIRRQMEAGRGQVPRSWDEQAAALAEQYRAIHPRYGAADWDALARRTSRMTDDGGIVPDYDPAILMPFQTGTAPEAPDMLPVFRARAHIPALLLHAEMSDILSADAVRELAAALPLLDVAVVPEVGHVPDLAEPTSVAAITRFLARCAAEA